VRSEPDPNAVIYLDNAATTPLHPSAAAAIRVGLDLFGNPSSRHAVGQASHDALERSREQVAELLGCAPAEVVFTGGGSEAINLALCGTFAARGYRGHLVTTAIEHSAVLESAAALQRRGVEVTFVPPLPSGHVDPHAVADAMRPDTVMVSVMHANNETGAIQPVEAITGLAHQAGKLMHVDAVQTAGKLPVDELTADLLSISAHKFGGPKGIGALRMREGHLLEPIVYGGGQEAGRRAGTENLPGVLGMAAAATAALPHVRDGGDRRRRRRLRTALLETLAEAGGVHVNTADEVMAETISVSFAGVRGDTLADVLDMHGVCVSTGSACHAADDAPSHVLAAMGVSGDRARSTIRISMGHATSEGEVKTAAERIVASVEQLRLVSGARIGAGAAS
jgi:cysteine desulfurase